MSAHDFAALLLVLTLLVPIFTAAHPCSKGFEVEAKKRNMNCRKKTLGVEFGWNYHNQTRRLDILFGARVDSEMGWLAWGVNPGNEPKMEGTRALIGIKQKNQTLVHDTYNITRFTKIGCQLLPSKIDLEVQNFSFFPLVQIEYYVIEASIVFPPEYDISKINLVWQVGKAAAEMEPKMHPRNLDNFDCKETMNLISGTESTPNDGAHKRQKLRMAHGILNIVGWGTFLPVGVIVARYFRNYPIKCKTWMGVHIFFQISGWVLGTSGWIIGIILGNASKNYGFRTHRILAIIIFTFANLQVLALIFKPTTNYEYRIKWNIYHHFLGYSLLVIITVNIFQGIAIINTKHVWRWAYIGLLGFLAFTALSLELFTWIKFWLSKRSATTKEQGKDARKISPSSSQTQGSVNPGAGAPNVSQPNEETDSSPSTS